VDDRPVAGGQHRHGGPRRDHGHRVRGQVRPQDPVAARRPAEQPAAPDQPRRPVDRDHHPIGQLRQPSRIRAPDPRPNEPVRVQPRIDLRDAGHVASERQRPGPLERLVVPVAALAARPVPGRQPGRLVQEVQLGQPVRRPLLPASPLELQHADDPGPPAGVPDQPARGIVQQPAVPPEQAAIRHGDQVTLRRHPILPRHQPELSRLDSANLWRLLPMDPSYR
jgi:hypothetical protein